MNKILKEEIERFQLLSNYDNKKTLDENYQSNQVISEANPLLNLLRLGGREAGTLSKTAVKEVESLFKLYPKEMRRFGVDTAEVIAKLEGKTAKPFTSGQLGDLRTTIFKNTTDKTVRREIADDMIKSKAWKDIFSSRTEAESFEYLIKKGYSGDDINFLTKRYKNSGGKFKDFYKPKTEKYQTNKPTKQRASDYHYGTTRETKNSAMSLIKSVAMAPFKIWGLFKTLLKLGLGIAVAYYIWKYFTEKGQIGYPDCLSKNIPADDFKKMVEEGREYILISDTGNKFIDDNEGGRFYQNGKFETENEKYSGSWKEDSSLGIVIILSNGDEHTISCEGMVDFELDTEPEEVNKFKSDFPMSVGDENLEIIGIVQRCLGLPEDGVFTTELEKELKSKYNSSTLTKSIFKEIMSDCGAGKETSGYLSRLI